MSGFFLCLLGADASLTVVRGLIAMAYPVKNYPPEGFDPKEPVHERVPPGTGDTSEPPNPLGLCHLDMNPYNCTSCSLMKNSLRDISWPLA